MKENRRRRDIPAICVCLLVSVSACAPCEYVTSFEAGGELSGSQVVPPVETLFDGSIERVTATLNEGRFAGELLSVSLTTSLNADDVTSVHIHAAGPGDNGPVIATVPFQSGGQIDGFRIRGGSQYQGTIPIEELFERLRRGTAYIDIHTRRFPEGELRGQLELVTFQDRTASYCGISN